MPKLLRPSLPCTSFLDGEIKLYLADSRKFLTSLRDGSVDMLLTDPPYGHNNNNNDLILRWECALGQRKATTAELQADKTARPIANDGAEAHGLVRWMFTEANRLLKPGCCCCCCCCGGGGPDPQYARWSLWLDKAIGFKQMVVWDKGPMGLGWHYRRSYETVLVGEKPGKACRWFDETNAIENIIRPGYKGIRKIIPSAQQHPTQKPVALAEHFIGLHTQEGDLVVDPFMGAGWAGIACVRMGRKFIGVEIDPKWYQESVAYVRGEVCLIDPLEYGRAKTIDKEQLA